MEDVTDVSTRDPAAEEALCLEIDNLCTVALTIDEAFYDIERQLTDAANTQNKRVDLYDVCHTLETRWNEHRQTYRRLLWESREFAGQAQATVDDFRELVLPSLMDSERTRSEKQEIIQEQIRALQETSQPSQELCQEFLDFGMALDTYIAEFSRAVKGLEVGEHSKRVDELEDRLNRARTAMESVSEEVKELGWKFAADVAFTGITLLLAVVIPTLWRKIAGTTAIGIDYTNAKHSGLQFLGAQKRRYLAVTEYEIVKVEYDSEKTCFGQMRKLETIFHEAGPLVQEVIIKLGIFANVWAAITADIRRLERSLHCAEDSLSPLFTQRVQTLEKMYGYLSRALRRYQVTVQLPQ